MSAPELVLFDLATGLPLEPAPESEPLGDLCWFHERGVTDERGLCAFCGGRIEAMQR